MADFATIAIPLWEDNVAPRFGSADQFLIVEIGESRVRDTEYISIADESNWNERFIALRRRGVTVILCGGFNNRFIPLAKSMGLEVKSGIGGRAKEAVDKYCSGTLTFSSCGCTEEKRRYRHRCRK